MVRSFGEIVYGVIELIRANYKVTDSIDERLIAGWVQSGRAELLKQRLTEPGLPDEHWVQDLGAVEMEPVDASISETNLSGKYMLRTKYKIPKTIYTRKKGHAFTRVGPADRLSTNWNIVPKERALYSGYGKFNKNDVYAFLDDEYLCLVSKTNLHKLIKEISIKGVFQNPIDAYNFRNGEDAYTWEMEYPVSDSLVDNIKTKIIKENFNLILLPLDDKKPDGVDNLTRPTQDGEELE